MLLKETHNRLKQMSLQTCIISKQKPQTKFKTLFWPNELQSINSEQHLDVDSRMLQSYHDVITAQN